MDKTQYTYMGDYYADAYWYGKITREDIPDEYMDYVDKKLAIDHMA